MSKTYVVIASGGQGDIIVGLSPTKARADRLLKKLEKIQGAYKYSLWDFSDAYMSSDDDVNRIYGLWTS